MGKWTGNGDSNFWVRESNERRFRVKEGERGRRPTSLLLLLRFRPLSYRPFRSVSDSPFTTNRSSKLCLSLENGRGPKEAHRKFREPGKRNVASESARAFDLLFRPPPRLSPSLSFEQKKLFLTCDELPAVVVPSFLKTVRSCPRDCTVTPGRMPSSSDTTMAFSSSVLGSMIFVLTGTISSRKRPEA